ncbi:hypothetical protein LTR37_014023 [Vermiconidia calcicola]|uniref:Uncharacterized protein n=1 Tax=Vermiconidia calcicola TaxID=1690605 RepID=A0ACC3MW01_9PEZI|nr:hypothetical protein LTR37_014023 [Vermiconidia calcicola]
MFHPQTTKDDNLVEIADKVDDRATAISPFLNMPIELRLQIYDHTLGDKDWFKICVTSDVCVRYIGRGCSAVATLSRTCKQIHSDVTDLLYKDRRFILRFSNGTLHGNHGTVSMTPSLARYDFLTRVRHIHIGVSVHDDRRHLGPPIATLERALVRLEQSSELQSVTFHVNSRIGSFREPAKQMRVRNMLYAQRRAATREGVKARRNAVERELDYALRVVKMLCDGTMA